ASRAIETLHNQINLPPSPALYSSLPRIYSNFPSARQGKARQLSSSILRRHLFWKSCTQLRCFYGIAYTRGS
ncbi:hypothetical protein U1Q18_037361, partial [Sarracenia purpurea var. burkii]